MELLMTELAIPKTAFGTWILQCSASSPSAKPCRQHRLMAQPMGRACIRNWEVYLKTRI